MKILIISLLFILIYCSNNRVTRNNSGSTAAQFTSENEHSPWKTIIFQNKISLMFPKEWKISRTVNELFMRPNNNKPVGVVIVIETNDKLNSLTLGKYYLEYYKNILKQKNILLKNLEDINLNGKPALRSKYTFRTENGSVLIGEQIILKHNNNFFYLVTEAPENEYKNFELKLKWIIESIKFIIP